MNISLEHLIQALADQTRLRSLLLLHREGELCVCEFVHALDEIQPKISRHLALLRDLGVVSSRRQGQWIYYQLAPGLPKWALNVIESLQQGANNTEPFSRDAKKLRNMPNRPGSACIA